tara:strand:+ start:1567 stop:1704 length:138 start_codon:yes stop_codon:yes gene_type:complete
VIQRMKMDENLRKTATRMAMDIQELMGLILATAMGMGTVPMEGEE